MSCRPIADGSRRSRTVETDTARRTTGRSSHERGLVLQGQMLYEYEGGFGLGDLPVMTRAVPVEDFLAAQTLAPRREYAKAVTWLRAM